MAHYEIFLKILTLIQLLNNYPTFYEIKSSIIMYLRSVLDNLIQFSPSHDITLKVNLIFALIESCSSK
jgi:hypothetical protein